MDTTTMINVLKKDDPELRYHQVKNWSESRLVAQYKGVFRGVRETVEQAFSEHDAVSVDNVDDFYFSVAVFGRQLTLQVQLTFARADILKLIGHVKISTDPQRSDYSFVEIPFSREGDIIDPSTGQLLNKEAINIQRQAANIVGAFIHDALPFVDLS